MKILISDPLELQTKCCDSKPVIKRILKLPQGKRRTIILCEEHKDEPEFSDPRNVESQEVI